MGQGTQCIHLLAIEQDIQFHQVTWAEAIVVPVKRSITFGDGFEFVVEVDDNLAEWHIVQYLHTVTRNVFLLDEFTSFTQT